MTDDVRQGAGRHRTGSPWRTSPGNRRVPSEIWGVSRVPQEIG